MMRPEPKLYAQVRLVVIYEPRSGAADREEAVSAAVEEAKQAVRQLRRFGAWAELEVCEPTGNFERE